jgi:hypothetical protein
MQQKLRFLLSSQPVEALPLGWRVPRRLERDFENFLALEDEWPAYRHWETTGKKKLYERALKQASSEQWAEHLGLGLLSRSQRTAREREGRVERELRSLFCHHRWEQMPSRETLEELGGAKLGWEMEVSGGIGHWAQKLGVPIPSKGIARTQERTEVELRAFLQGRSTWPAKREFELAGKESLLQAVYQREGSVWWATKLGLKHPSARPRRNSVAARELASVLAPVHRTLLW